MQYNEVVNKGIQSDTAFVEPNEDEISQEAATASQSVSSSEHNRLTFVEIFAGSAKLSAKASRRGFRTISIDHDRNAHKPHHQLLLMDLTDGGAQSLFFSMFHDEPPAAIAMAPPCGTCSRARERKLPNLPDAPNASA